MKVLITGARGMLGRYLLNLIASRSYDVTAPLRAECDLNDPAAVGRVITTIKPAAVFHLAAQTDVDLCEREPDHAFRTNSLATEEIARAAAKVGSWLAYISTGSVFGAEGKLTYNETDHPGPVNLYGRSKLRGEAALATYLPDHHLIVRAGWMIGGGPSGDHKFVGKIVSQIRGGASELRAVDDKHGTLTVAEDLAKFLLSSMEIGRTGLVHYSSKETITRFQIASEIARLTKFAGQILPVKSDMFPLSASRPFSEGLESIQLSDHEKHTPGNWRDDLRRYIVHFDP